MPSMEFRYEVIAGKVRRIGAAQTADDDYLDYCHSNQDRRAIDYWTVSDNLPEQIPVTPAEIDLFQAYFGDILDDLLAAETENS